MLLQCPGDVLGHQRRLVVASALQGGNDLRSSFGVAQCDGNIAQPALVTDTPDGRAFSPL